MFDFNELVSLNITLNNIRMSNEITASKFNKLSHKINSMKKTLIEIDDKGFIVINHESGFSVKQEGEKIIFEPEKKEKNKEPLTWEEIMASKPVGTKMCFITGGGNIGCEQINDIDIGYYRGWVNTQRQAEKLRAMAQLMVIADHYNPKEFKINLAVIPCWSLDDNRITWYISSFVAFMQPMFASISLMNKAYEHNKEIFETALKP